MRLPEENLATVHSAVCNFQPALSRGRQTQIYQKKRCRACCKRIQLAMSVKMLLWKQIFLHASFSAMFKLEIIKILMCPFFVTQVVYKRGCDPLVIYNFGKVWTSWVHSTYQLKLTREKSNSNYFLIVKYQTVNSNFSLVFPTSFNLTRVRLELQLSPSFLVILFFVSRSLIPKPFRPEEEPGTHFLRMRWR